jgi:hypothetical protein
MEALARIAHQQWNKERVRALRCVNLKKAIQARLAKIQKRKAMLKRRGDAIRRYHALKKATPPDPLDVDTEPEDEIIETDE